MTHLGELNSQTFFCDCGMARKGDGHTCVQPVSKREQDDDSRIVLMQLILVIGLLAVVGWVLSMVLGGQ